MGFLPNFVQFALQPVQLLLKLLPGATAYGDKVQGSAQSRFHIDITDRRNFIVWRRFEKRKPKCIQGRDPSSVWLT
jgi:hypothetical protein